MSYRCPRCKMKFNREEHARCGRCPTKAQGDEPSNFVTTVSGEFWPKSAQEPPAANSTDGDSNHE